MDNKRFNKLIKKHEGFSPDVYDDTQGNPTIGAGTNLNSPEVPEMLEKQGLDVDAVRSGEQLVDPSTLMKLSQEQLNEKRQYLDNIRKRDFPNARITPEKQEVLESLMYNSPALLGPNLRDQLNRNDEIEATKEILLRSNKNKDPGIQKRRLDEARTFSGKNFQEVMKTLTPEEKAEIRNLIQNIKNVHERNRVFEMYPELSEIVSKRPFRKLIKD
jgi:GH24 family phage-related lysozyme (muramidase)